MEHDLGSRLADHHGAALYEWYAHGELKSEGTSISEGIGQGRITANLDGTPDIVVANYSGGSVSVLTNTANGSPFYFAAPAGTNSFGYSVASAGDINGDG